MIINETAGSDLSKVKLEFAAKWLPMLASFAGKNDIRWYINGLRIESAGDREGVYLVATDGHRMGLVYDKTGRISDAPDGAIMSLPPGLVAACKPKPKAHVPESRVIVSGSRVYVAPDVKGIGGSFERYVMPGMRWWIEGRFPDWRRVLPKDWSALKPGFACQVNSSYVTDFAKIESPGRDSRHRFSGVTFWQASPDAAVVVQLQSSPEFVGLVMPQRDGLGQEESRRRLISIIERKEAA